MSEYVDQRGYKLAVGQRIRLLDYTAGPGLCTVFSAPHVKLIGAERSVLDLGLYREVHLAVFVRIHGDDPKRAHNCWWWPIGYCLMVNPPGLQSLINRYRQEATC